MLPSSFFFPACQLSGKTLLAKAVANQTSATFLRVVGSELIQKYLVSCGYNSACFLLLLLLLYCLSLNVVNICLPCLGYGNMAECMMTDLQLFLHLCIAVCTVAGANFRNCSTSSPYREIFPEMTFGPFCVSTVFETIVCIASTCS